MIRLEHLGIAVADAADAVRLFETLLGVTPYKTETVEREGVRTHFLATETTKLELLEALGPDSPVARHLARRGPGLHHVAFEVPDAAATMERLRAGGFTPLSAAPRPGADGKAIFFLHPKQTGGVLVEFCQSVPTPLPAEAGFRCLGAPTAPAVLILPADPAAAEPLLRRLEPAFFALLPDPLPAGDPITRLPAPDRFHVAAEGERVPAALDLARRHPGRVHRLALCNPSPEALTVLTERGLPHPTLLVFSDDAAPGHLTPLRAALPHAALAVLPEDDLPTLFPSLLIRHFGTETSPAESP